MSYLFTKMNGLGNDFVIFDTRDHAIQLSPRLIQHVSNRRLGAGCDQVLVMKPSESTEADVALEIYNADGAPAGACGNGTRCIAWLQSRVSGNKEIRIATADRIVTATVDSIDSISVDIGKAICQEIDLNSLGIKEAYSVYVGNPHVVLFVEKEQNFNLEEIAVKLQNNLLFPEGTNVEIATVINPKRISMKVWERGVGITAACGTGACAAAVAAYSRQKVESQCKVYMPGGVLSIKVSENLHVTLSGGVKLSYTGILDRSLLDL